MEQPKDETQRQFEQNGQNTRLEYQPNALLEQVKAQKLEEAKARNEKGAGDSATTRFRGK